MLSEEKIALNYTSFIKRMIKYGFYPEKLKDDAEFGDRLRKASAFTTEDSGGAYAGSLIEHINKITTYAVSLNNLLPEEIRVDQTSLVKTCFLHQIAKAIMIKVNEVEWEIKKGKIYAFEENLPAIKCGEHSLYLCQKYGIEVTSEEYEAILSIDKKDDEQTKYFGHALPQILRMAVDFAVMERKELYKKLREKKDE